MRRPLFREMAIRKVRKGWEEEKGKVGSAKGEGEHEETRGRGEGGPVAGSAGVSPAPGGRGLPAVHPSRFPLPASRHSLLFVATLWTLAVLVVGVGAFTDRGSRSAGPEAAVMAYAAAVERSDLDGALEQLVPAIREPSASWVAWQMGNSYRILESSVRTSPLSDRLLGRAGTDSAVVVVEMEIEGKGNPIWRTVVEVPARLVDGKWLLARPPLEGL